MAMNCADAFDLVLVCPDRKMEFSMTDRQQKRFVFSTTTNKMNLSDEDNFVARPGGVADADINSIYQEVYESTPYTS